MADNQGNLIQKAYYKGNTTQTADHKGNKTKRQITQETNTNGR